MQPFSLLRSLRRDSIDYVRGKYPFIANGRSDLDDQLKILLSETGTLFQDPVLQLGRARKKAPFDPAVLEPKIRTTVETLAELKTPYAHQIVAWNQITRGVPTVVSTGTGSGKSESFIIPILNGLSKQGFGGAKKDIGGLFIYPMNALVQDQFLRIFKYAAGSGLRVGIYNGAFKELKEDERRKICFKLESIYKELKEKRPELEIGYDFKDPKTLVVDPQDPRTFPHILLTNYKMLEYMLLRAQDQPLVDALNLKYLVLDEAHTYTGTLALEISCLLTRLRVHLGEDRSNYLPVATSATLSSGRESPEEIERELSILFTKLFGKTFPQNGFLVGEQYEELPRFRKEAFTPYLEVPTRELGEICTLPFPKCLESISKRVFGLESPSTSALCQALHIKLAGLERELSSVLLTTENGTVDSTLSWSIACHRFQERVGGSPELLECMLIALSQAYVDFRFPLLGMRVHVFGRSEPKLLWTLDGAQVGDLNSLKDQAALTLVSCKRCGQMALGAEGINAGGIGNVFEELELRAIGDFADEVKKDDGTKTYIFHPESSLSAEDQDALGKDWTIERWNLFPVDGSIHARQIEDGVPARGLAFLRAVHIARRGNVREEAPDVDSCPKCGATGRQGNAVMVTHRGGAATDISVYSASVLTNTPDPKEQKLLIFADNRQETSFLAGFLTDRHRKLNLRRALTGYLVECHATYGTTDLSVTKNMDGSNRTPRSFDLAVRLILSLEQGKAFDPSCELPQEVMCRKTTLQNLIPRSVLDRPYWEKSETGTWNEEEDSVKQWLLENYRIGSLGEETGALVDEKIPLLDGSVRGNLLLGLLTELLLLDLSAGGFGEGHLSVLGLAMLKPHGLDESVFTEFAGKNPDLLLTERGVFLLSKWLLDELLYSGKWSGLDATGMTRRGFLPKHVSVVDPRFVCEKQEHGLLGKSINNPEGLHKASRLARVLADLDPANADELRKVWAKKSSWDRLIQNSPLRDFVFYSDALIDAPRLKAGSRWVVTSEVEQYRGSDTHSEFCIAPKGVDLSGIPTGKRTGDVWQKCAPSPSAYYVRLLNTPLRAQSKLVRAREHNGMLSAADANDALLKFEKDFINTLIATPTLEMGVDLPDLPTVIHRSVPPAASNYAQRAGRAGRGPKRAFILTYCGLGSHDMTFFEEPKEMVCGEILPPGIPDRNPFIIKRHVNGLILEVLGLNRPELGKSLQIRFWHDFVDVSDLRNRLQELARNSRQQPQFRSSENNTDWLEILRARKSVKEDFIERFLIELARGLWTGTKSSDLEKLTELKNELRRHASEFEDHFRKQISAYRGLVSSYFEAMEPYNGLPSPDDNAPYRQAKRFAEANLGAVARSFREIPMPLSDLSASGFLPNFDFPGQVIRFKGLRDDPRRDKGSQDQDERMLQYDRGGTVALREFAPDQKVYGHGFIYKVERYLENDLIENQARGYGVCSGGCTTLAPRESESCPECQAPIVKIEKRGLAQQLVPEIIQIREVHGSQEKAISDGANFRERHFFTEESRRIGVPVPDEHYQLKGEPEVDLTLHLSKEHYLKTVFLVLNTKAGGASTAQKVFYRKRGTGTLHRVALEPKEGENDWEPFIPSIQIEGQGIIFHLPFHVAHSEGLVGHGEADGLATFQATLCTLIERASQRVLRLGSRSGNFDVQVHKIMELEGEVYREKSSSFVMLDREPGGSGVIPLVWECWDEIMEKIQEALLKNCCKHSCYRCLRSFDNQSEHHLLDKQLFIVEGEAPLADFLKRDNFEKRKHDSAQEVDRRSPAEEAFKALLLEHYPEWSIRTQVDRMTDSGGLLTVPDFELSKDSELKRITVYIDGWKYHQDPLYFFGDIRKRNELAGRGYRVVTLPAGIVLGSPDRALIATLLSGAGGIEKPFPIAPDFDVSELIPRSLDPHVKEQMLHYRIDPDKLQVVNVAAGFRTLSQSQAPIAKIMCEQGEKMPKYTRPIALGGDDRIVMRVNESEILTNQDAWKSFWVFYSCLTLVGYRPFVIWTDPKPTRVSIR